MPSAHAAVSQYLELLDWRRQVGELFAELRRRPADEDTLRWFRASKDDLFRTHPQSPIPPAERSAFAGLDYWPYDGSARVHARFVPDPPQDAQGAVPFRRIGTLTFELHGRAERLPAFWIEGYAGGLFVPFRDTTCGHETYGGGRYLLDTIKSADFGSDASEGTVVLDFNYAYHPSCAYDPRWVCPLAPPESRLPVPVTIGERFL
jgi:uncharacterized protein (DUF1684 family)